MEKILFHFNIMTPNSDKRIFLSFLFIISFYLLGCSQTNTNDLQFIKSETYQSLDKAEIAKLKDYDFQENFAVLLRSDNLSNYFFIDISKLPSSFAFKYFLYLSTQSGNRFQSGHGLSDNRAWFICENNIPESQTLQQILSFKQRSLDKDLTLSEKEKEDWIKSNNY